MPRSSTNRHQGWILICLLSLGVSPLGARADFNQVPKEPDLPGRESDQLKALRFLDAESDLGVAPPEPDRLENIVWPDIAVRWHERVLKYVEFFRTDTRGRAWMTAWLKRAKQYRSVLTQTLKTVGVPTPLMYVAMVESGFTPTAKSQTGAFGLWQLMPAIATEYGLHQTYWVDERLEPMKSTEVAGHYLRDLRERLGTWELALAAYNMGYSALLKTIQKYNSNDFWTLSSLEAALPYETSQYVPKILACAIIGENPEKFGFNVPVESELPPTRRALVPGGIPLITIASALGLPTQTLKDLNPELRRDRMPLGPKEWSIRIPQDKAGLLAGARDKLLVEDTHREPYIVRFGERARDISKRFAMPISELRDLNDLGATEEFGAGTTIWVRKNPGRKEAKGERLTAVVPSRTFQAPPHSRHIFYRTTQGDTLKDIAHFFSVTKENILSWNTVDAGATVQPGMVLQLYVPQSVNLSRAVVYQPEEITVFTAGSPEFFEYHESQKGRIRTLVKPESGDTLASIATRYNIPVASLSRINQIPADSALNIDQSIVVYLEKPPEEAMPADKQDSSTAKTAGIIDSETTKQN